MTTATQTEHNTDALFINAFLKGTIHTLKVQCSYEVSPEKSVVYKGEPLPVDICGIIGLTSSVFRGNISLCFPKPVFLSVMGSMFGEKFDDITDELSDGVGELLNIIFGTAKTEIVNAGFTVEKAIPTIIRGQDIRMNSLATGTRKILVPFSHGEDKFHILISLGNLNPDLKSVK